MSDKIDIRKIIFVGLILTTFAVINFANFSLNNNYNDIVWMRIYYAISIAFLATTVNTVAYYDISPEKKQRSGIIKSGQKRRRKSGNCTDINDYCHQITGSYQRFFLLHKRF